jgi:hypothetical protein
MAKSKLVKFSMFIVLAVVLAFATSVSATGTSPNVSRVVYFTVQSNVACGAWDGVLNYRSDFNFNVNNTSDVTADVTVYLYKKDGTLLTNSGNTGYGYASELTPGTSVTIGPNQTVHYSGSYGYLQAACSDRPAYGKIVVHSNNSLLMATGEMQARRYLTTDKVPYWETYNTTTVTVNQGNPF